MSDPYAHMEEAWGLDENPFPGEGVSSGSVGEHYSEEVFPEESKEFRTKIIRGGLQGGRKMGFLWSKSPTGEDTGFGKTSLMRHTVRILNADWGDRVQRSLGIKPERVRPIAGAFAELNEQSRNGLYPILFAATQGMAAGPTAILPAARELMVGVVGSDDADAIADHIVDAQIRLAPAGQALRGDMLDAFLEGGDELAEFLSEVSDTSRLRNGIQYFTGALYILAAAGVEKTYLMLDQLEDLGKKGALSAAKRRREIGRIRDLLEIEPYASLLHTSFTFHQAAAQNLELDWEANRLPSFDPEPANQAAVVVLRGLEHDSQVEELLKTWMEPHRNEHAGAAPISPFTNDVLPVLKAVSGGRPGVLLNRANELFWAGAEQQLGGIDGGFAQQYFSGHASLVGVSGEPEEVPDDDYADLLS